MIVVVEKLSTNARRCRGRRRRRRRRRRHRPLVLLGPWALGPLGPWALGPALRPLGPWAFQPLGPNLSIMIFR